MSYYSLKFTDISKKQYIKLDNSIKEKVKKKLILLKDKDKKRRHFKFGELFFVDEVGQYRIVYELKMEEIIVLVLFIGKHKDYDNYLK